jgi:hypothetical protein
VRKTKLERKKINISSLSQLTLCGVVFIFLFLIPGCFLQEVHDAEADLLVSVLFPSEADEKTQAHRLMDVYEVRGFLTNEPILHESMGGAAYVPHLELDVEEIIKIEPKDKGVASPVSTKNEYLKITCRQVSDDFHGIYQMGEATAAALGKRVSIQGTVYRCGDNWYICEKDETEIYCDTNGKEAYVSSHIQLMNMKTDKISKSK